MERDELFRLARTNGWHVVGHRWVRMMRDESVVEVWFGGEATRLVSIKYAGPHGEHGLNIVSYTERHVRRTLMYWLHEGR